MRGFIYVLLQHGVSYTNAQERVRKMSEDELHSWYEGMEEGDKTLYQQAWEFSDRTWGNIALKYE